MSLSPRTSPSLLLSARALEFAYLGADGQGQQAPFRLGPIDLELYSEEFLVIIGPNGSGKSTLLRLLSGQLAPGSGRALFSGADVSSLSSRDRARRLAVVRQEAPLVFPTTVEQYVLLGRYPYTDRFGFEREEDRGMARLAMEATHLCSLAGRRMDEISGGERQRAVLARALAQEPELLLLDEPTANLDLSFQIELLRMVRRLSASYGFGVVAVMHEVNLASEFADCLLMLHQGTVFKMGVPEEVLTAGALEQVYGVPVRVERNPFSGRPQVTVMASPRL